MAVAHVNVVAEQNHAPVVILELVRRKIINLLGLHAITGLRELEQGAASITVAAGTEDVIVFDDWRGDVSGTVGDFVVAPQEFPVAGAHADKAAAH